MGRRAGYEEKEKKQSKEEINLIPVSPMLFVLPDGVGVKYQSDQKIHKNQITGLPP